jgi:hypothetical protein
MIPGIKKIVQPSVFSGQLSACKRNNQHSMMAMRMDNI